MGCRFLSYQDEKIRELYKITLMKCAKPVIVCWREDLLHNCFSPHPVPTSPKMGTFCSRQRRRQSKKYVILIFSEEKLQYKPLLPCTCDEVDQIYCKLCDAKLLMELSEHLPTYEDMRCLGINLGIHPNAIKACREDNSNSIRNAVFEMLYRVWYHNQDGLRQESEGLYSMKQALVNMGKGILLETVVEKHFN